MFRTENEFVHWLRALSAHEHRRGKARPTGFGRGLRLGIGDDAALVAVRSGHELILTSDMSIEDVHFTLRSHPPRAVGHRALARSLSDVAAMGGIPRYVLVSLAISPAITRDWVSGFYRGMLALARRFGVELVGGDTAWVPGRTFIDVLVAGEVPRGKALRRSGARAGDALFVSGRLGLSALGFRLIQSKRNSPRLATKAVAKEAVRAHLQPEPQCALGRFLSECRLASALMDLSDGLSTDLSRLCAASGVGAQLWAEKIPGPGLPDAADSLHFALHGGEDYQLLFAVPRRRVSRLPLEFRGRPLYHIGEIEASAGVKLVTSEGDVRALEPAGWDHLRKREISDGRVSLLHPLLDPVGLD